MITHRVYDAVFRIPVCVALAAIENAVAVNPDLDISEFIRPQTAR